MNNSGYSNKPLVSKLGYMPGDNVYAVGMPANLQNYFEDEGIQLVADGPAVWFHGFFSSQEELEGVAKTASFDTIEKGLWFCWPKRASSVSTDLTEQTFRDIMLPMGWVDTKVAAIDQTWSGLKFLRRKK
jgi:hypothetical protein